MAESIATTLLPETENKRRSSYRSIADTSFFSYFLNCVSSDLPPGGLLPLHHEAAVESVHGHKLLMRALLDDLAVIDNKYSISSVLSIVEISRKSGAELEGGVPGKCSKIKCFLTLQERQASRGKGSKDVRCSLRIWREFGSLERKFERKEREQRATHTRLVLVKQMR